MFVRRYTGVFITIFTLINPHIPFMFSDTSIKEITFFRVNLFLFDKSAVRMVSYSEADTLKGKK